MKDYKKYFIKKPTKGEYLLITIDKIHNLVEYRNGYIGLAKNMRVIAIEVNLLTDVITGMAIPLCLYEYEYLKMNTSDFESDYNMYTKPLLNELEKFGYMERLRKQV